MLDSVGSSAEREHIPRARDSLVVNRLAVVMPCGAALSDIKSFEGILGEAKQ
jgi:hypothetical protein